MARLSNQDVAQAMVANGRWATRLGWDRYGAAISTAIGALDVAVTSREFAEAVAAWQTDHTLTADGIVGPETWTSLRVALAPPLSLTGVLPPDVPPVPDGFEAILATFGDPRLAPDGSISTENLAIWERQILARGILPFEIPVDPQRPQAGVVTSFYAHRRLVRMFEAVFHEIDRLGLRGKIHSWGGIYNFRSIRGVRLLSLHAFGAAIDLNAETNVLGTPGDMSPEVIEVFRHFGFFWGGDFHGRPDPMHFQYATGY